jgi:hypothetical protein
VLFGSSRYRRRKEKDPRLETSLSSNHSLKQHTVGGVL